MGIAGPHRRTSGLGPRRRKVSGLLLSTTNLFSIIGRRDEPVMSRPPRFYALPTNLNNSTIKQNITMLNLDFKRLLCALAVSLFYLLVKRSDILFGLREGGFEPPTSSL